MAQKKARSKTLLLCLICTFLWGAGYPVVKMSCAYFGIANNDVAGKLVHAGLRFTMAGILLLLFSQVCGKRVHLPDRNALPGIIKLSLCQTVLQYGLLYVGLANTSGTKGSVLNQINVFLLVLFTPLFFRSEKLTRHKLIGCIIGFAGIVIMNMNGLKFTLEWGDLVVILSSCCAAAGYLLAKAMPPASDPIQSTGFQQLLGGCVLLVIGLSFGGRLYVWNVPGAVSLLFLVAVAAAAYSLWFYLLQHNDVAQISVYKFLTPIFGVTLSGLLLHENIFTVENMAALALVCIGVTIANGVSKRHREEYPSLSMRQS